MSFTHRQIHVSHRNTSCSEVHQVSVTSSVSVPSCPSLTHPFCTSLCISLTEDIRLQILGSQDPSVFLMDLLSDGDSATHVKIRLKSEDFPRKHVWYVRGLQWKQVECFVSRNYLKGDLLRPWYISNMYISATVDICRGANMSQNI